MTGVLLIDKPTGISSFDVIRDLRRRLKEQKMGYLGTLDPLATGLLVLFLGTATKLIPYFSSSDKTYIVDVELGKTSDSYDITGKMKVISSPKMPSSQQFKEALWHFLGPHLQVQPPFSALKFQGKRAYEYAREGVPLDLGKREVTISSIDVIQEEIPLASLLVSCSSGTYMRSFVHELGQRLNTGAIMTALRRSRVGPFRVEEAFSPDQIKENALITPARVIEEYIDFSQLSKGEKVFLLQKFAQS